MSNLVIPVIGLERLRMGTDGTGVRTLIGTYGCPLRCKYCLNPHSWNAKRKPSVFTPEQLYSKVSIDNIYFQSTNGGITIGGGEPLVHIEALTQFAALCPDSWTLWAETSLYVDPSKVTLAASVFDHFLVDIKSTNADIYKAYTSKELTVAIDNLLLLKDLVGADRITVRIPQIPGFVDGQQQLSSSEWISSLGFGSIDLFTYGTNINK